MFLCLGNTILHLLSLAAPVWFACSFGSGYNVDQYFYGLFYVIIVSEKSLFLFNNRSSTFVCAHGTMEQDLRDSYQYGPPEPETEALDFFTTDSSTDTLFVLLKFQVIISVILWIIMFIVLIKEKPLNIQPYTNIWKLFGNPANLF